MTARIVGGVVAGVAFGGVSALLYGMHGGPVDAAGFGLVFALLAAFLGGGTLGAVSPPAQPLKLASGPAGTRAALLDSGVFASGILDGWIDVDEAPKHQGRGRAVLSLLAGALGVGAVLGWFPSAIMRITDGEPIVETYVFGAPAFALIVFMLGLHWIATAPAAKVVGTTPRTTFRQDRAVLLLFLAGYTVGPGVVIGVVAVPAVGVELGIGVAIVAAIIGALLHAGVGAASTCWTWYYISRLAARRTSALPPRPLALLEHATRAGVLREVGAYFEFRHPLVRDHLANRARSAESAPSR